MKLQDIEKWSPICLHAHKNWLLTYNAIFRKCKTCLRLRDIEATWCGTWESVWNVRRGPETIWSGAAIPLPWRLMLFQSHRPMARHCDCVGTKVTWPVFEQHTKHEWGWGGQELSGIWGRNGRLEESQKKSNGERSHHAEALTSCLFRGHSFSQAKPVTFNNHWESVKTHSFSIECNNC